MAVEKYFSQYAEREALAADRLAAHLPRTFPFSLVIPCFDEAPDFIARLLTHPEASNVLLVVVINQPDTFADNVNNKSLFEMLTKSGKVYSTDNVYYTTHGNLNLIVIDRFSNHLRIKKKNGVGLARKIGVDTACRLVQLGCIQSDFIYSSDADAHLPANYFSACERSSKTGAMVFDFTHIKTNSAISAATQNYEQAIKYYMRGLQWAVSPYAFYTLGSALAVSMDCYCQVRGFPKRPGGEDFYLLNKIAKIARVEFLENILIHIESRLSNRVPFGTGPAVKAIMASDEEYSYYHPAIFTCLKQLLCWANQDLAHTILSSNIKPTINAHEFLLSAELTATAREALISLGFNQFLAHVAKQCRHPETIRHHFHWWFDGFRTLKFIRFLQDNQFAPISLPACIDTSVSWSAGGK